MKKFNKLMGTTVCEVNDLEEQAHTLLFPADIHLSPLGKYAYRPDFRNSAACCALARDKSRYSIEVSITFRENST